MKGKQYIPSGLFKEFIYVFKLHLAESQDHPWETSYRLSAEEKKHVVESIRQFQLGEASEGKQFISRAEAFSNTSGHSSYVDAVKLFIAEEQRHSQLLGRFLEQEGIPPIRSHWVDWCFRSLRHLAGAQTAATVLVTAELIARPYYRALRGATKSPLLRSICQQIIEEEEIHIEFQAASVAVMQLKRPLFLQYLTRAVHSVFMEATCLIAWREHGSVFTAGNYTFQEFKREAMDGVKQFHNLVVRKMVEFNSRLTSEDLPLETHLMEKHCGKLS